MSGIREEAERALIERARGGDRVAFGLLVETYLPRVYRVAFGIVRNREEAADIAQDALVRAYRGIRRFDPSRPARSCRALPRSWSTAPRFAAKTSRGSYPQLINNA